MHIKSKWFQTELDRSTEIDATKSTHPFLLVLFSTPFPDSSGLEISSDSFLLGSASSCLHEIYNYNTLISSMLINVNLIKDDR